MTLAQNLDAGAVLHTHSVWGTLLSDLYYTDGGFRIEVRLNRAPLDEGDMAPWLEQVVGHTLTYAPLPSFP